MLATPTAEGIVICSDTRGFKSDGTEIESAKLFIISPNLVLGGTGDTAYFAGDRPIFDLFQVAGRYLRGIENYNQVSGLGKFLQAEFRSLIQKLQLPMTPRPFQVVVFYIDREHTPYLYSAKLTPQLAQIVEEHRGGKGTVFFQRASLLAFGENRLYEELEKGHDERFDDLRNNGALMDIIRLKRSARSLTSEEAISIQRLLIRETSKRIDHQRVSEDSRCLVLPYAGAAAWK